MTKSNISKSLVHIGYSCKYHIVIATKYRRKVFYNEKLADIRGNYKNLMCYGMEQKL